MPIRNDLDMISISLAVYENVDMATKHEFMDKVIKYQDSNGIVQVYFEYTRPCIGKLLS